MPSQSTPEQWRAHVAVHSALYHGTLVPAPCTVCGRLPSEGHHPDYARPLDVVWLCRPHHRALHPVVRGVHPERDALTSALHFLVGEGWPLRKAAALLGITLGRAAGWVYTTRPSLEPDPPSRR